jgi:Flp pilus assembly protein TadG
MLRSLNSWRLSNFRCIKRFGKREDGAAAVEFALVALPFFALMIAIIELGIYYLASRFLEDGVFNASRKVLTQRLASGSICSAFKTEIESELSVWLSPSRLSISVTPLSAFGGAGAAVDLAAAGCNFGASGQTMIVTATYQYPFVGFRFNVSDGKIGADTLLSASTAFRVE